MKTVIASASLNIKDASCCSVLQRILAGCGVCREEDQTRALRAFELRAQDVNLGRKRGGGLMKDLEPGQTTSAHLPPPPLPWEHPLLMAAIPPGVNVRRC